MPYDARVFQILIASPGDVQEERKIIAEVIYEWNHLNSRDRRVVLLPLRWETHSSPEMGSRAQAVINKQVVDYCDMAVGVFWTRVGTPTPEAESGTVEELARIGDAGKPVMLYFSKSKVDPESFDLEEYRRLKDFKAKTYPQGLTESYSSPVDFREKFARQLTLKMLDIVAEDSVEQSKVSVSRRLVTLSLAHGNPPEVLPNPTVLELNRVICPDISDIPDFAGETGVPPAKSDGPLRIGISRGQPNPAYYRELVEYYCWRQLCTPLRLAVTGFADQGVRDLYIELRVSGLVDNLKIIKNSTVKMPRQYRSSFTLSHLSIEDDTSGLDSAPSTFLKLEQNAAAEWRIGLEIPVVQARRTVFSANEFWLTAERDGTAVFDATVYSSESTPFSLQVTIDIQIKNHEISYVQIVKQFEDQKIIRGHQSAETAS